MLTTFIYDISRVNAMRWWKKSSPDEVCEKKNEYVKMYASVAAVNFGICDHLMWMINDVFHHFFPSHFQSLVGDTIH